MNKLLDKIKGIKISPVKLLAYIIAAASAVAAITPTDRDNQVMNIIHNVADIVSLNTANPGHTHPGKEQ